MKMNPKVRHTVADWRDLPPCKGRYVRASDPRFLTHGFTGDSYLRADGAPWEHHGYAIDDKGARPVGLAKSGEYCTTSDPGAEEADAYWNEQRKQERAA